MPASKPAITLKRGMEPNNIRPNDCVKFRCKLLDSANGTDAHRIFTGVYFPRHRNMYIDEVVNTVVGGLRGLPIVKLIDHYPLDVYFKSAPSLTFKSDDASQSQLEKHYYFVTDFFPGAKLQLGPSAAQRDRVPRTYTITEVDLSLLRTGEQEDAEPPQEDFQTLRLRSLDDSVKEILLKIREAFIERCGGVTGAFKLLGRRFRIMDDNGNRMLSRAEFVKSVADVGLELSKSEIDVVFEAMDADGNGNIDFEEYLNVVRGPMHIGRKLVVQEAFAKIDLDRDGFVTLDELKVHYDATNHPKVVSGEMTVDDVLKEFASVWDVHDRNGKVTFAEFCDYYNGISASIDDDEHFELLLRRAWKLPGWW